MVYKKTSYHNQDMTLIHQYSLLRTPSDTIFHPTGPFQHVIPEILEIPLIKPMFLPSNHPKYPCKHCIIMEECCMRKGMSPNIIYPFFSRSGTILVIYHDLCENFFPFSNSNVNGFPLKIYFQ